MTISPPAKIQLGENEAVRVLVTGVDTLVLAVYVAWLEDYWLQHLETLKEQAKELGGDAAGYVELDAGSGAWHFNVKPHGREGYEWLVTSKDLALRIARPGGSQTRPGVMVELRSEMLWRMGASEATDYVRAVLAAVGAQIAEIKPSRVDLCADVLMRGEMWSPALLDYAVTRAVRYGIYGDNGRMHGISIGRGTIQARLYDKVHEIETKSHKTWMLDIWGTDSIPDEYRVIRVEFQLRRDALKDLGCLTWDDLMGNAEGVWGYCTQKWLKFCDNPGSEHKYRNVLPWWQVVVANFLGMQDPKPLVREKAFRDDRRQVRTQIWGLVATYLASQWQERGVKAPGTIEVGEVMAGLVVELERDGFGGVELAARAAGKMSKHQRGVSAGRKDEAQ